MSDRTVDASLTHFLKEAVERYGDMPVMTFEGNATSYEQLLEKSERLATALAESGVSKVTGWP